MSLCINCSADDHEFTTDGLCEHKGYSDCTCEYSDTDPAFNDRWASSVFISRDERTWAALVAGMTPVDRTRQGYTERQVERAVAIAAATPTRL